MNALTPILESTREAVARRRADTPLAAVQAGADRVASARAAGSPRPFAAALARPGLSIIAEHKRRSPSAGLIREGTPLPEVVSAYERAGAAALSILTEEANFGGCIDDLRTVRAATGLPILRKDFIVDSYQVAEAVAAGADAILLIVAALAPSALAELSAAADAWGLDTLVEVHDARELEVATALGARIIGINNRDLTTLGVDTERTFELLPAVADGVLVVAESGIRTRADLERLDAAGVAAALVGEALMRAPDIEAACRALTGVGTPTR